MIKVDRMTVTGKQQEWSERYMRFYFGGSLPNGEFKKLPIVFDIPAGANGTYDTDTGRWSVSFPQYVFGGLSYPNANRISIQQLMRIPAERIINECKFHCSVWYFNHSRQLHRDADNAVRMSRTLYNGTMTDDAQPVVRIMSPEPEDVERHEFIARFTPGFLKGL